MDTRQPATLFNDVWNLRHEANGQVSAAPNRFHGFQRLPPELRSRIWEFALQQNRAISFRLEHCRDEGEQDLRERSELGYGTGIERPYRVVLTRKHRVSPLLITNHEARHAALRFYRIKITVSLSHGLHEGSHYLCPEFDYVHIHGKTEVYLPQFLHDIKTHDPRGLGVLKLGIGLATPMYLRLPDPNSLEPSLTSSFKTILANLEYVFFRHVTVGDGRMMSDTFNIDEIRFNHSYPIYTPAEMFDLIENPRDLGQDLEQVAFGGDPYQKFYLWQEREQRFDIRRGTEDSTEFVFHFSAPSCGPNSVKVLNRVQALEALYSEHQFWRTMWAEDSPYAYKNLNVEGQTISPAVFGWWVLPVEDLQKVDRVPGSKWYSTTVASLQECRPKLMIMQLE